MRQPKVALVHDYLNQYGGAERVLEALHQIWPETAVFTSVFDKEKMASFGFETKGWDIRTSFMQKIPFRDFLPRFYFTFLYPYAFSSFDLKDYDVIISSASYAAKNIKKPKGSIHICYCHTPPRFLWGFDQETNIKSMNFLEKLVARVSIPYLRKLDLEAVGAVDYFVANSGLVATRIKEIYNRESKVIYPPVDVERFRVEAGGPKEIVKKPYFLVISRLGDYKRVDIVVEAFKNLDQDLKIIGVGPRLGYLQSIAGGNVEFLGRLNDEETTFYLQKSLALIFPTEEDFGITPLEALSAGKAVIAYRGGGVLETLNERSAKFFYPQNAQALEAALKNFDPSVYNPNAQRELAYKFSQTRFKEQIKKFVEGCVERKI